MARVPAVVRLKSRLFSSLDISRTRAEMHYKVDDVRIREIKELAPPAHLLREFPASEKTEELTYSTRQAIHRILHGSDDRVLVIVGPCSIHDPKAGLEYALRLLEMRKELERDLVVVMRVYFEKPRTTVGWKGLVNDPDLDGSYQINKGLRLARQLLMELNEIGMPAGLEFLDMITPQYYADLASWGAIGARTTESQVHRELASGLSCPVGFKNSTNGNEDCHIILRGGKHPNYDAASVDAAAKELAGAGLEQCLMIDCSHSNSQKMYQRQVDVAREVARQVAVGDERIDVEYV